MGKTWLCLLLAAIVFFSFYPALRNGFVGYDDSEYVTDNPRVNTGLTAPNITWAFTEAHSNNWHPLTWLSHALDSTLFGLNPAGHHLTSLLLHIASTVLLFLWLSHATGFLARSAFVAAVFGLHPLHVESVAWVAERKDVLSALFLMLTLIAYSAYAKRPGLARYGLVAALLTAGLMAKQMLVTVPLLLLLLDWWPLNRKLSWKLAIEKVPLIALAALASAITLWAQRRGGATATTDQYPISLRLSNAAFSYIRYIWKTIWPTDLAVFYPLTAVPIWIVLTCLLAIAVISCLVFMKRKERPWLATGWLWYLLTLLPVIGIVQVGMQAMADRYMYIPMIGLLIAVTWECAAVFGGSRLLPVTAALALTACAVLSWRQIHVWQDGVTLFTHALAVTENNFLAHDNLGVELDRRGRHEEALAHYRETLRIKPGDRNGETNYSQALFAKGARLFDAGNLDEALATFREGLRYRPRHALARTYLGLILTQQRQLAAAIAELRAAIQIDPALARAHMGLGVAHAWSGDAAGAARAFQDTLRYEPSNVEAHYDLGLALAALGRNKEALESFTAALRLKPDFAPAQAARAQLQ